MFGAHDSSIWSTVLTQNREKEILIGVEQCPVASYSFELIFFVMPQGQGSSAGLPVMETGSANFLSSNLREKFFLVGEKQE